MASRAGIIYIPVVQLIVPQMWRVGRVTFRPPGWVGRFTTGQTADPSTPRATFEKWARDNMTRDARWSTAAVPIRWPEKAKDRQVALIEVTDAVRDAVAVLLLYQHALLPYENTELQQFGLHMEIGSEQQSYVVLNGRDLVATGTRLLGVPGDWEFTREHVRSFRADPRFAYVDVALRTPLEDRTDLQKRAITAVRTRAAGSSMQRAQTQVVLLATAVEALLGDPDESDDIRGEYFRIARRGAYLYCGTRVQPPHLRYPTRPACALIRATTHKAMVNVQKDRASRGQGYRCTWFEQVYGLMDARNAALHEPRESFSRKELGWHEIVADHLILNTLEWTVARGARRLIELNEEIDAFAKNQPVPAGYPWVEEPEATG